MKRKGLLFLGEAVCLIISYLVCRFGLFSLHGMKDWPNILFAVGMVMLLISLAPGMHFLGIGTAVGYLLGFLIGFVFQSDGFDPGGGRTNNLWKIWMFGYLTVLLIGLMIDLFRKHRHAA